MTATETNSNETPTSKALATVDNSPRAMVKRYEDSFAAVLPSHITRPETWIRVAQGALKKGKRIKGGQTELEVAAANNPGVFLASLLDCARLGLEPGTEQYYLTPRPVKGRLEILGIVGYQGHIELMYRAGAISSVVAEAVYSDDLFIWTPGLLDGPGQPGWPGQPRWEGPMVRPFHDIDWDADDRGQLRLVYAYATMKDGSVSKVVVLNRAAINRVKASSQGSDSKYSPWVNHPESMWLKSAVRQLQKWVPTSAEYRREQMRTASAVVEQREALDLPAPELEDTYPDDDEPVDAEIVEDDEPREYADDDPERPM